MLVTPLQRFFSGIALFLLILLLIWAPLPLGSNRGQIWYFNAFFSALILGFMLLSLIAHGGALKILLKRHFLSLFLFFLICLWAVFQYLPLDIEGVSHPLWDVVSFGNQQLPGRVSVNPKLTFLALLRMGTYVTLFLCVFMLSLDSKRAHKLLYTLCFAGVLYALYGLIIEVSDGRSILWFEKKAYLGNLTSTFVNRNSAATYFGLISLIGMTMTLRSGRHSIRYTSVRRTRDLFAVIIEALPGRFGLWIVFTTFMLTAVIMTASRAGISTTIIAHLILIFINGARHRGGLSALFFAFLIVGLIFTIIELAGGGLAKRFALESINSFGRYDVYLLVLEAIRDHFWFGTGLGTFEDIFFMYLDPNSSLNDFTWDKAHNTYLEVFLGLGVPVGTILMLIFIAWAWQCLSGSFKRNKDYHIPALAFAASILVGIHALVDFSLQIQAVAIVYTSLLAMGLAQASSLRKDLKNFQKKRPLQKKTQQDLQDLKQEPHLATIIEQEDLTDLPLEGFPKI